METLQNYFKRTLLMLSIGLIVAVMMGLVAVIGLGVVVLSPILALIISDEDLEKMAKESEERNKEN